MAKKIWTGLGIAAFFLLTSCSDSEFSSTKCVNGDCTTVTAQSFSWEMDSWSRCSRACGGGTKTRSVQCLNKDKVAVTDDKCGGIKPATSATCSTQACTSDYAWNQGPWGNCSKTCGGGQTYRNVTCQSTKTGAYVAEPNCTTAKPAVSKACNTQACPTDNFNWKFSNWSACSKTCGGGTWSRTVTCQNASGVVVSDSNCSAASKPSATGSCNTQACTYGYSWTTGSWGTCSKTCGSGTQSRSLACVRDDGVYVPHSLCGSSVRPETTRACNTQACPVACTKHSINKTVAASGSQVDILLVVDDSGSMYKDSSRLATKLSGFVSKLQNSNVDWQMCVTSTDTDYFKGRPIQWQGANSGHILKRTSGNLHSIFVDTMKWIGAGFSSDEQGIKAMNLSVQDNYRSKCYRRDAGLAVIVISDEDERSVGGNQALSPNDYKPLGPLNTPQSFLNTISSHFPAGKRVVVNSIIVKDSQCLAQQNAQGERAFYGTKYQQLSNLTGGGVQSICSPDFTISLNHFHSCITRTLGAINLKCAPKETKVYVNGSSYLPYVSAVGNQLIFNPVVKGPATITGSYCCK